MERCRGYVQSFFGWLSQTSRLPRNPFQRIPHASQTQATVARFVNARGRRVPQGTPGSREVRQNVAQRSGPKRSYFRRGWYWLWQCEAWDQPTYHNLQMILKKYNALPDDKRREIDPQHFDKLPAGTPEERKRSANRIYQRILRARLIRDRDAAWRPLLAISKGSYESVCRLFCLWYAAPGTPMCGHPARIRDRWNRLPIRIRLAVAECRASGRVGHAACASRKLPPGQRGQWIVRGRIREAVGSYQPVVPVDGRGDYFVRLEHQGWSTEKIWQHWNEELTLEHARK